MAFDADTDLTKIDTLLSQRDAPTAYAVIPRTQPKPPPLRALMPRPTAHTVSEANLDEHTSDGDPNNKRPVSPATTEDAELLMNFVIVAWEREEQRLKGHSRGR
jgi:hypothetical protein